MKYITNTIIALSNIGAIVWLMYCDYAVINSLVILGILIVDVVAYDANERKIIG